jgi:uncharacterized protein with GYD domain
MPRYLFQASYTSEGARGLLKDGALGRRELVEGIVEGLGGRLETFDFAFGEHDVYLIAEMPEHVDAAAVSLAVAASGAVELETVVLLSAEEMDAATRRSVGYRPPGA